MNQRLACAIGLFALCSMWAIQAMAHPLSPAECSEGGEFIRNAALARDNGITREFFVNKLVEDLIVIESFPPQLRWLVQDANDEKLLSEAVFSVFDEPMAADQHQASFFGACMQTAGSTDGTKI